MAILLNDLKVSFLISSTTVHLLNSFVQPKTLEFERYHFADELYTPTLDNFDYPQYEDLNEHLEGKFPLAKTIIHRLNFFIPPKTSECETYRFAGEPFLENVNALDGTDYAYYYVSPERSTGQLKYYLRCYLYA